jgi:hypothetical protein
MRLTPVVSAEEWNAAREELCARRRSTPAWRRHDEYGTAEDAG